jgi:hypothetical protein
MISSSRFGLPLLDWGAIAFFAVLLGAAIRSIKVGFGITDALDARFGDRPLRAQAALVSNHAIPALAKVLVEAAEKLPAWALTETTSDELSALMQDELLSYDYVGNLRELGNLAVDHDRLDTNFSRAETWGLVRGIAGAAMAVCLVFLGIWVLDVEWNPAAWLVIFVAALGAIALTALSCSWCADIVYRRRLVMLCRKFEV